MTGHCRSSVRSKKELRLRPFYTAPGKKVWLHLTKSNIPKFMATLILCWHYKIHYITSICYTHF